MARINPQLTNPPKSMIELEVALAVTTTFKAPGEAWKQIAPQREAERRTCEAKWRAALGED